MCQIMEELNNKVAAMARRELSKDITLTLLTDYNLSLEKISEISRLPLEEVKEIAAGLQFRKTEN